VSSPDLCILNGFIKRLFREIFTWQSLDHPHVLPFMGVLSFGPSGPCMVSPWMHNGTLINYVKNNNVTEAEISRLVCLAVTIHNLLPHSFLASSSSGRSAIPPLTGRSAR
jgi:serine/threonine protein kinase